MNKNSKVLQDFVKYCEEHPEERFWQALRNWSGQSFIYVLGKYGGLHDTYYWNNKNE